MSSGKARNERFLRCINISVGSFQQRMGNARTTEINVKFNSMWKLFSNKWDNSIKIGTPAQIITHFSVHDTQSTGVGRFVWRVDAWRVVESVGRTTLKPDDEMKQTFAAILSSFDRLFGSAPYRYIFFSSHYLYRTLWRYGKSALVQRIAIYFYLFSFGPHVFGIESEFQLNDEEEVSSFWWRTKSSVKYSRNSGIVSSK